MTTLNELDVEVDIAKMTLDMAVTEVTGLDPLTTTKSQLRRLIKTLGVGTAKLNSTVSKMVPLCAAAKDFAPYKAKIEPMLLACNTCTDKTTELLNEMTVAAAPPPPGPANFKLEKIKIPAFSGRYEDWQSFYDLFNATVHNHASLSGAEKLTYLKAALKEEAALVVNSFQINDANYDEAWAALKTRHNNKHEVINAHLRKLDDFKTLQQENSTGIRSLLDTLNECVRSLKVLSVPVSHWDLILIYWTVKKLANETRKQWALKKTDMPDLKELLTFLETRSRGLASVSQACSNSSSSSKSNSSSDKGKKSTASHHATKSPNYLKCSDPHTLFKCEEFTALPLSDKNMFVRDKKLCLNCLFPGHTAGNCKSAFTCKTCEAKHNTHLHSEAAPAQTPPSTPTTSVTSSHCVPLRSSQHVVLMATLLVHALDATGIKRTCRVFLDPGSEANFVSEHCVDRLGLKRRRSCIGITGLSNAKGESSRGLVSMKIYSRVRDFTLDINALVLRKITALMPRSHCQPAWPHLDGLQLSDPSFHVPGHTDILLGAEVAASLMLSGIRKGPSGTPTAQNTQFGWMLSGPADSVQANHITVSSHHSTCVALDECRDLQRFWELEEPESSKQSFTHEEEEVEAHYLSTYVRNQDGGYTVELPFKADAAALGHSRSNAIKRLKSVERRHSSNPEIWTQYVSSMQETAAAGFMELVPQPEIHKDDGSAYYMPHHAVLKPGSTTTKCRIVFDASAKTSSHVSLNNVLHTGPKLQVDLFPLLIRFRSRLIAMSADIVKFYPQYKIKPHQADLQRFVWRETPELPILDYRMTRLTFGVTAAPFLAIRSLHQLAEDERDSFPMAADVIKEDFLVDNLLSGADDVGTAIQLQSQLLQVMEKGNLQLRKWTSNSQEVLDAVPSDHRELPASLSIDDLDPEVIKTIGLLWQPGTDTFGVSISIPNLTQGSSKRRVLSSIARIFDPLGWLSPVTVRPKILMQELWKANVDWDSPLPTNLHNQWIAYSRELEVLKEFQIPRCILKPPHPSSSRLRYELLGFSDASNSAYAACVFIRVTDNEDASRVTLVAAKTKVAPVKSQKIPRLELCSALLLSKLIRSVQVSLNTSFSNVRCWTDSTTVLGWLSSKHKLPVFVANRVHKIVAVIPAVNWLHVPGLENPADCASRGISAASLIKHPLWFTGPP